MSTAIVNISDGINNAFYTFEARKQAAEQEAQRQRTEAQRWPADSPVKDVRDAHVRTMVLVERSEIEARRWHGHQVAAREGFLVHVTGEPRTGFSQNEPLRNLYAEAAKFQRVRSMTGQELEDTYAATYQTPHTDA